MNWPDTFRIFIPSRGRAGNLLTPYTLPADLRDRCRIVVSDTELPAYDEAHKDLQFWSHPTRLSDIGRVRQWIMELAMVPYAVMLDDDIRALHHKPTGATKVRRLEGDEAAEGWRKCFLECFEWLDTGIPVVGISSREAAWLVPDNYYDNGKLSGEAMFLDRATVKKVGARFDRVPVAEDMDMTLQMLRAGYRNRRTVQWSISRSKEGASGGCSEYRTTDTLRRALEKLQDLHPGIVEVAARQPTADRPMEVASHTKWRLAYERGQQEALL